MANEIIKKSTIKDLTKQVSTVVLRPTDDQLAFKVKYYNKCKLLNISSPELAPIDEIQRMAGVGVDRLASWWTPQFEAWFRDKDHIVDKIDILFEKSIDELASIISGADKDQDRLAAIRALVAIRTEIKTKADEEASGEIALEQLEPLLKELGYVKASDSQSVSLPASPSPEDS